MCHKLDCVLCSCFFCCIHLLVWCYLSFVVATTRINTNQNTPECNVCVQNRSKNNKFSKSSRNIFKKKQNELWTWKQYHLHRIECVIIVRFKWLRWWFKCVSKITEQSMNVIICHFHASHRSEVDWNFIFDLEFHTHSQKRYCWR